MMNYYKRYLFSLILFCSGCTANLREDLLTEDFNTRIYYPEWIFGLNIWEDNKNELDAINSIIENYEYYNLKYSSVLIDSPWSTSYNDFILDEKRYPNFSEFIEKQAIKGKKTILWVTGFQNISSSDSRENKSLLFDFYEDNNWFTDNSLIYEWWKGKGAHVDFTNDEAVDDFVNRMLLLNVDGWKLDEGYSYLRDSIGTSKGRISKEIFANHFYYKGLTQILNESNVMTYGRAYSSQGCCPRLHSDPVNINIGWTGDHRGDFQGIEEQLTDIILSIQHGHNLLSWEVGGYNFPKPNSNELIQSLKIGSLLPTLTVGGRNGSLDAKVPWQYGNDYIEDFRFFIDAHYKLVPLYFSIFNNKIDKVQAIEIKGRELILDKSVLIVLPEASNSSGIDYNLLKIKNKENWIHPFTVSNPSLKNVMSKVDSIRFIPLFLSPNSIFPYYLSEEFPFFYLYRNNNSTLKKDFLLPIQGEFYRFSFEIEKSYLKLITNFRGKIKLSLIENPDQDSKIIEAQIETYENYIDLNY